MPSLAHRRRGANGPRWGTVGPVAGDLRPCACLESGRSLTDLQSLNVHWAGARAFFPDSRDITLPGQGHDVNSASWGVCAGPLTQTFIEQASLANLNTSCLAAVPAPPFNLTIQALAEGG